MSTRTDIAGHVIFDAAEHRKRVEAVADGVRARGLDAVLAWARGGGTLDSAAEVLWLTGFYNPWLAVPDSQCWSGQSHCAALVTAAGECTLISNLPRGEWSNMAVFADSSTDEPFIELGVRQALGERKLLDGCRVGLAGRSVLTVALHDRVLAAAPDVLFIDADELLIEARRPKSEAELAAIRDTGRIGSAAMSAMLDASQPGATERDVAIASHTATIAAGGLPYSIAIATGRGEDRYCPSTLPTWSDRVLQEGEIWHCDFAGAHGGYIWDFARTTVVGTEPTGAQLEMIEAAIATVEAVITEIAPGVPVGDAVRAGHAVRRRLAPFMPEPVKHDYPHLGHTLGVGFGDIWLYENERRPFEAGMYVAVEAVVAREADGFAMFEENLIVGPESAEIVTTAPKRPWESAVRTEGSRRG